MKEIKAIVAAYEGLDKTATKAALATVVRVEGSSYRRTGARMLVLDNGVWVGGISGGCLEGDALKRARLAIAKASPSLITYDTTTDDEHQIGVGLGCNGIIDVLFVPLDFDDENNPVEVLKRCLAEPRKTHVLLTVTAQKGAWKSEVGKVIRFEKERYVTDFDEEIQPLLAEKIKEQQQAGKSSPWSVTLEDGRKIAFFIEILPPEIHVILMGHQYDVFPLTRLLKELGWRVSIVAKPEKVNQKIKELVDELVTPEEFSQLFIDSHTAIVLMSHDYATDKRHLPLALATVAPYIGLLGPRVRSEKILRELQEEGKVFSEKELERIYAPVGLDIGAVQPEEIALSLAAEIRAVFSYRTGGYLRLRSTTIHERG